MLLHCAFMQACAFASLGLADSGQQNHNRKSQLMRELAQPLWRGFVADKHPRLERYRLDAR